MKSNASTRTLARILTLTLVASVAAACSVSTPSAKAPIKLPALPAEITACSHPILIPDRAISRSETEVLWRKDRLALVVCANQLDAHVRFYNSLRNNLDPPED